MRIIATCSHLLSGTWRNAGNTAVIAAVFILIGVLHFAMLPTVLLLTAVSIALAYLFPLPRD